MTQIRLAKIEDIFRLALRLKCEEMSLSQMAQYLRCSKRTAERVRDMIGRLFGLSEETDSESRKKFFSVPPGPISDLTSVTSEDLAALETAMRVLENENMIEEAGTIANIRYGLQVALGRQPGARVATDLEALMEAEGFASRPGPRPEIVRATVQSLHEAMKACRQLSFNYRSSKGKRSSRVVYPYGIVFGHQHYLLAWCTSRKAFRYFALSEISKPKILQTSFRRRKFSVEKYTGKSFGIFVQKAFSVKWIFDAEAASEAGNYYFHHTQTKTRLPQGRLSVEFNAGGALEMCWHLFRWGNKVKILKPKKLKILYRELLRRALRTVEDDPNILKELDRVRPSEDNLPEDFARNF